MTEKTMGLPRQSADWLAMTEKTMGIAAPVCALARNDRIFQE